MKELLHSSQYWMLSFIILTLGLSIQCSQAFIGNENEIKSAVFLSPKFVMTPGSVANKFYHNIDFPKGHVAIKDFNAEVVDESGQPVSLQETYLHHWIVLRYYHRKGVEDGKDNQSDVIYVRNKGPCPNLPQYFGLGSETRKTMSFVPDPYGIEIGNPSAIPDGYEEKWLLNVHAIDTRGVVDRLGCTECRCDLYNVAKDEYGKPLSPDYVGGLKCCYDEMQCKVKEGFGNENRGLYMKYTIKWMDWSNSIVPVRIYIFDITDVTQRLNDSKGLGESHNCLVEYEIDSCSVPGMANNDCINSKRTSLSLKNGGRVIYAVAHQHSGGIGSALYGGDGRVICSSIPIYGKGEEAGNEAGYIVGMSTCYPEPGSVQIYSGETLTLESNYSSQTSHTGLMGLFYVLIEDDSPKTMFSMPFPIQVNEIKKVFKSIWALVFMVITVMVAMGLTYFQKNKKYEYESLVM